MQHTKTWKAGRPVVLLAALLLLLAFGAGATLAYLDTLAGPVENRFIPSRVTTEVEETFDGTIKSKVAIRNTGDTQAWIRGAVVITWQDANGNVAGKMPVEGKDYTISYDLEHGWIKGQDGFCYWTKPVDGGALTGVLIENCTAMDTAPDGYFLTVEILGSGIQSKPARVFNENWYSSGLIVNAAGDALEKTGGGDQ